MDYCRQLLKLADLIEPQLSPFRGQLLFELQAAMEHHIIKNFKPGSSEFRVGFGVNNLFLKSYLTHFDYIFAETHEGEC